MLENHHLQHTHTVFMGSKWMVHSTLVGASLWLLIWALFSLLFSVFSDVPHIVDEKKEVSFEGGTVKEQETITKRLNGLGILGESGFESSLPQCMKLEDSESLALESEGDVVIGGFFPLHYLAPRPQHSYSSKPQFTPCSG